jgi:general secretion pathway protein K
MPMTHSHRQQGVVLLVVLFFSLLLTSSIATFTRRSIMDVIVARNRDAAATAEALARSGIRLGKAILILDRNLKQSLEQTIDSQQDAWYQLSSLEIPAGDKATMRIQIEDSGSRFNLNSVFNYGDEEVTWDETEPFLQAFFEKVIDEMKLPPGEVYYDIPDLAAALIDWVDADDAGFNGREDDYYQMQEPPYHAANGPLMSVDDLFLIQGFDHKLVEALRPYISVEPFAGGGGVNLNTAPPHVLSLLYFNDGIDDRLAKTGEVQKILDAREGGGLLCGEESGAEGCTPITTVTPNAIFPPPIFSASIFKIVASAHVGDINRSIEAVINRSVDPPVVLSWIVR